MRPRLTAGASVWLLAVIVVGMMKAPAFAQSFSGPILVDQQISRPVPDRSPARTDLRINHAGLQATGQGNAFWFDVEVIIWKGLDETGKVIEYNFRGNDEDNNRVRPRSFQRIDDKEVRATAFLELDGDTRQAQRKALVLKTDRPQRIEFDPIPANRRLLPGLYKIRVELVLSAQRTVIETLFEEHERYDEQNRRSFARIDPRRARPASATVIVCIAGQAGHNRYEWMTLGGVSARQDILDDVAQLPKIDEQLAQLRTQRADNVVRQAIETLQARKDELMAYRSQQSRIEADLNRLEPLERAITDKLSTYDTELREKFSSLLLKLWQLRTDAYWMTHLCMPNWRPRAGSSGPDPLKPSETMDYTLDDLRQRYSMTRFLRGRMNEPAIAGNWNETEWKTWAETVFYTQAYALWNEFRQLYGDPLAPDGTEGRNGLVSEGGASATQMQNQFFDGDGQYRETFYIARHRESYNRLRDVIQTLPMMIRGFGNQLSHAHFNGQRYIFHAPGNPRAAAPEHDRGNRLWQGLDDAYTFIRTTMRIDPLNSATVQRPTVGRDTRQHFRCPNCHYTQPRSGLCPLCREADMQKVDDPFQPAGPVDEGSGNR